MMTNQLSEIKEIANIHLLFGVGACFIGLKNESCFFYGLGLSVTSACLLGGLQLFERTQKRKKHLTGSLSGPKGTLVPASAKNLSK